MKKIKIHVDTVACLIEETPFYQLMESLIRSKSIKEQLQKICKEVETNVSENKDYFIDVPEEDIKSFLEDLVKFKDTLSSEEIFVKAFEEMEKQLMG